LNDYHAGHIKRELAALNRNEIEEVFKLTGESFTISRMKKEKQYCILLRSEEKKP